MKEQNANDSLGNYLLSLRRAKGMSLRDVEEATDHIVSNAYLSQLERGTATKPSPHVLHALASVYEVGYEALMESAGYLSRSRKKTGKPRGVLATLKTDDFTAEMERQVIDFVAFLRGQRKREGK